MENATELNTLPHGMVISDNGDVLNWLGENYYRLDDADMPARLAALESKMDTFIALATQIKDDIEPALEGLRNSPIGKMLGV